MLARAVDAYSTWKCSRPRIRRIKPIARIRTSRSTSTRTRHRERHSICVQQQRSAPVLPAVGAVFSGCTCDATLSGVDLDNWPKGTDGAVVSVDGLRVVGQAYNSSTTDYVSVRETVSMHDYGTCCIGEHH